MLSAGYFIRKKALELILWKGRNGGKTMKLATWNVNGIRSVLNKGALQEYVLESNPDILCLTRNKGPTRSSGTWHGV